jgi:hypothetical protein
LELALALHQHIADNRVMRPAVGEQGISSETGLDSPKAQATTAGFYFATDNLLTGKG